ncbi:hypothetical protein ACFYUY_34535 [Kitasatospora sp. NPDC004745]|uniref:hypothetical protein n=1 Tax=Kitasatospora sp. NPDC004745 TaxID=3364019 RepID=UPI0036B3FBA4
MLPRTVRGVAEVAAGLVEEVGKRVVGTAAAILERTGVDVADVERRLGGQFPPSVQTLQTLAGEAVTAGRAGVDLAVGVARGEVEKAFEKVGDQVTKVGVVLAYLESKLREVEEDEGGPERPGPAADAHRSEQPVPAPRADDLFGRGWEDEQARPEARAAGEPIVAERVEVDEPVEVDPPVPPVPRAAPTPRASQGRKPASGSARPSGPAEPVEPVEPERPAARKGTAKKAPADAPSGAKAPGAKSGGAEPPGAKKAAAKKAAKKTAVRKTAVKKTATAKQSAAESAGSPGTPAKRTATKKTTVRKATSTKRSDDRSG